MNLKYYHAYVLGLAAWFAVALEVHAQPIVMKIGVATINDTQHQWMKFFAGHLEKRSGGRIKVELYPAGQLGSNPRMTEATQFGSIQGTVAPAVLLSGVDSRYALMDAPGLFNDLAHAGRAIQDPKFNAAFLALGANKGLKGVGLFINGPLAFETRTPVRKPADLQGMKIRVLASDMELEQIRRLKATPVPMNFSEVLAALQTGTIDGQLTTVTACAPLRCYDAGKYLYATGHAVFVSIAVVSKVWFDKLAPDLQKHVVESGKTASDEMHQWSLDFLEAQRQVWLKAGGEITYPTREDQAYLQQLLRPVGAQVVAKKPREKALYELLLEAVKRTEKL
ncbi:MAG TPA: TRAP transporter substrate-binding protein [Burkholderiales bacterium]